MNLLLRNLLLITLGWSCTKRDNSSFNKPCTDSCTTVQGRFITGNNEPIGGINLEVRSERRATLNIGGTIRKIASGKTDANGFYSLTFSVNTNEYNGSNNYVFLKANYDRARFLPIPWYDMYGTDEIVPITTRRDTSITMDYYLPSKAQLKLQLINFTPSSTADSFYALRKYHDVGYNKRHVTESQFLVATQATNEKIIQVAGNQQNNIIITRKKGGIRTVTDTLIFAPTNQTTTLTLSY